MNSRRLWWTGVIVLLATVAGCDGGGDLPDPSGPSPEPPAPP